MAEIHAAVSVPVARPPMRYGIARALNLFLVKHLGMSRVWGLRAGRAVNFGLAPFADRPRRRLAEQISTETTGLYRIDPDDGYVFPDLHLLPELAPALAQANSVVERARRSDALKLYHDGASKKQFLTYALQGTEAGRCDDIMRLVLAPPILEAVSAYLGTVPLLNSIDLMLSLPNDSDVGSQLYHLDFADERQVKLFVCVEEVTDEHGPFTFVPAQASARVAKELGYDRGRLTIEQVTSVVGREEQIPITGKPGRAIMVDTARCLHFGSRHNRKTRVMLLAQYSDYYVPEQPPARWPADELARRLELDPLQRMALTI